MKICMITSYPPFKGGIALYSEKLVKALVKLNTQVTLYAWNYEGFINRFFQPLKQFFKLRKTFKEHDVVHVQYHVAEYMFLFLPLMFFMPRKTKLVLTLHEDYLNLPFFIRWYHNIFYCAADLLLVHTEHHYSILASWLHKKTKVMSFGMDELNIICNRDKFVLLPGFINTWKGQDIFIKAVALIQDEYPDYKFIIAGHPHDEKFFYKMKHFAEEHDVRIEWIPRFLEHEEYHKLLGRAELVVLPYRRITMSAILADVISHNTPVILSHIPAFEEYIKGVPEMFFFLGSAEALQLSMTISMALSDGNILKEQKEYLNSVCLERGWGLVSVAHLKCYKSLLKNV